MFCNCKSKIAELEKKVKDLQDGIAIYGPTFRVYGFTTTAPSAHVSFSAAIKQIAEHLGMEFVYKGGRPPVNPSVAS